MNQNTSLVYSASISYNQKSKEPSQDEFNYKMLTGNCEKRFIYKLKINDNILKTILNTTPNNKSSLNLMIITTDRKVLLLQRTQSFYFSKVIKDFKNYNFNFALLEYLYTSEMEKIRRLFFEFMPPINYITKKFIHIFPGGHSKYNESVISALLRELKEETTINLKRSNLRFNQKIIFKVLIFDLVLKKTFKNFIFPVKVDMTSCDMIKNFKQTKHTQNPTLIDIGTCFSLYDAFIKVQKFMLL